MRMTKNNDIHVIIYKGVNGTPLGRFAATMAMNNANCKAI